MKIWSSDETEKNSPVDGSGRVLGGFAFLS